MYRSPIACYGAKDVSSIGNTMACPRWQNLSFSSTDKILSRRGGTREKTKSICKTTHKICDWYGREPPLGRHQSLLLRPYVWMQ